MLPLALALVACAPRDGGPDETGPVDTGASTVPPLALEEVVGGFVSPVSLAWPDDGSGRLFVVDQPGTVWEIGPDGTRGDAPWADLRDRVVSLDPDYDERGLLDVAFHPDFAENGRVYAWWSAPLQEGAPADYDHTNVLAEFRVGSDGTLDPSTQRTLLAIDHPYGNHNGGELAFGPDGMLYLGLGDGGGAHDVGRGHPDIGNGQDVTTRFGSILRLDVDGGEPYGIPADNPFADGSGAGEIYAYGFRNPYSFSFDRETGELWVGDVGQSLMEEVDLVERGGNYGWNLREGTVCFDPEAPLDPPSDCPSVGPQGDPLVDPVLAYAQQVSETAPAAAQEVSQASAVHGMAVVGGFVYRGEAIPDLVGHYVFGDWSAPDRDRAGLLLLGRRGDQGFTLETLPLTGGTGGVIPHFVLGFGEGPDGELYVLTSDLSGPGGDTGMVRRLREG